VVHITKRASVSEPTVFLYFPTHEVLIAEVLNAVARVFIDIGDAIHAKHRSAPEIFLAHLRIFGDLVDTHPDHIRVLLEWSTAAADEVRAAYSRFQK
jgi:AcrR family transcriptional regulator